MDQQNTDVRFLCSVSMMLPHSVDIGFQSICFFFLSSTNRVEDSFVFIVLSELVHKHSIPLGAGKYQKLL